MRAAAGTADESVVHSIAAAMRAAILTLALSLAKSYNGNPVTRMRLCRNGTGIRLCRRPQSYALSNEACSRPTAALAGAAVLIVAQAVGAAKRKTTRLPPPGRSALQRRR